jgi:hypothetical protein
LTEEQFTSKVAASMALTDLAESGNSICGFSQSRNKHSLRDQTRSTKMRKLSMQHIVIALSLIGSLMLPALASSQEAAAKAPQTDTNLAGTWTIVWKSSDFDLQFVAMVQFSSDGNFITTESDELAISQGVWQRVDGQTYLITGYEYDFPGFLQPYQGTFKNRARLKVSPNNEILSGNYHLDYYDTHGVLQFSDDGTISGYRVHVQAMP